MERHHPDFNKENQRLYETKQYIKKILEAGEGRQESFKGNIKEAFENLDYLDSSLSYINILVNAKFIEMTSSDLEHLKRVENKPYFARIDFKSEHSIDSDAFYIGKVSLFKKDTQESLIVDWRSPIASVYYDGRLGEVEYFSEDGKVTGELTLKRQFTIEEGKLVDIRDIDITTRDDLLQSSLSGSADNRLTEIVSTIQAEQNEVIRADLTKPIIVQGVAGSGKTTIALHRISMFIYTYSNKIDPEEMMILAPNHLFIDYISEALPDLGVEQIKQTTYSEYVRNCIGKKIKVIHPDEKLLSLLEGKNEASSELIKWSSSYKGSLDFKEVLKRYVKDIQDEYKVTENFKVEVFTIYKAKNLNRLFFKDYNYLPLNSRVKKIKSVLQSDFKKKKKEMIELIEKKFEDRFDQLYYSMNNTEERRKKVVHLNDQKEKKLERIKQTKSKVVTDFIKEHYPSYKIFKYYQQLMTNRGLLQKYTANELTSDQMEYLLSTSEIYFAKNQYEYEDLAPLLYLQHLLYGIDKKWQMKKVVIDEAQDYSLFQFYALQLSTGTDLFTILGDLSQGIHSYRGLNNWEELTSHVLTRSNYKTLKKSYRTTIEIMNLANELLGHFIPKLDSAEPVVRHGRFPAFQPIETNRDVKRTVEVTLQDIQEQQLKTIAIITKTVEEAKRLKKLLQQVNSFSFQWLKENEAIEQGKVAIVPAYLAKGLEFDAVVLLNLEESYTETDMDIKLLYVAMTRPLHRLEFIGRTPNVFLLNHLNHTKYVIHHSKEE
ncbi:RNA polymerase recycling motor HelD [Halobacillus aidingensis]|uniref:DNA helicase-2 / ATP-dependent DNA helicase PcrA n=1 Tax=Halobacillus aidingensis TaxID=240303 RepID=A0A1H0UAJ1_HALAD|nr:RNA polymerase recycling motor HelD [Halobacillus aidingensis]SDP63287.1 DNA helicase-2 / ATP-dependent DNA helicase PcrA [Halobacillus aidingensis]